MEALPIIIAIGGALSIDFCAPVFGIALPGGGSFIISFIMATAVAMLQYKMPPFALITLVFRPHVGKMLALIAAIFIFKEQVSATNVVDMLATALSGKAAFFVLFFFLPVLMGSYGHNAWVRWRGLPAAYGASRANGIEGVRNFV
jgi:hypothetical protein